MRFCFLFFFYLSKNPLDPLFFFSSPSPELRFDPTHSPSQSTLPLLSASSPSSCHPTFSIKSFIKANSFSRSHYQSKTLPNQDRAPLSPRRKNKPSFNVPLTQFCISMEDSNVTQVTPSQSVQDMRPPRLPKSYISVLALVGLPLNYRLKNPVNFRMTLSPSLSVVKPCLPSHLVSNILVSMSR